MIRTVTVTGSTRSGVNVDVRITTVLPHNLRHPALSKLKCTHEEWGKFVHATHPHMLFLLFICFCSEKDLLNAFAVDLFEIRYTTRNVQVRRKQFLKHFMMSLHRYCTGNMSSSFCSERRLIVPQIHFDRSELPEAVSFERLSVFTNVTCQTTTINASQQRYVLVDTGKKLTLFSVISIEEDLNDKSLIDARDCLFNCPFRCFCTETNSKYVFVRSFVDLLPIYSE